MSRWIKRIIFAIIVAILLILFITLVLPALAKVAGYILVGAIAVLVVCFAFN